jgi:hypothetical protein
VAVLADLGDQDARPAPFRILEGVDQRLHWVWPWVAAIALMVVRAILLWT